MWSFTRPGETVFTAQCPIDLRAVTSFTNAPMRVSVREAGRGAVAVWLADGDGMRWTRGCATGTLGKFECGSIRRGYGGEGQDEVSTWNFRCFWSLSVDFFSDDVGGDRPARGSTD